jgi:hypothetical protein
MSMKGDMGLDATIVFIHSGHAWYLPYALHQAKWASPQSEVVLLGRDHGVEGTRTISLDALPLSSLAKDFRRAYVHMSTNSEAYEFFCFQRWFCLLEFMRLNGTEVAFYFDSDILLYSSTEEIAMSHGADGIAGAYLIDQQEMGPMQVSASAHASYWTRGLLEDFCHFVVACYEGNEHTEILKRKWQWHLATNAPGGVCDMTALYLFWTANTARVANLAISRAGATCDLNINYGSNYAKDEYKVAGGRKKVTFIGNAPTLERTDGQPSLVRAHALHFQGGAKAYMPWYYRGPKFRNKARADAIGLGHRVVRNVSIGLRHICSRV